MTDWRPVVGFSNLYEVSDDGQVRSWKRGKWGRATEPKLLSRTLAGSGYYYVHLDGVTRAVHVLVARAFHGAPIEGQEVRHLDGVRTNNHASNLAWGTRSENAYDCVDHGTNRMSLRTHCPTGHPYDEANTMHCRRGDGRAFRSCRACRRERYAASRMDVA